MGIVWASHILQLVLEEANAPRSPLAIILRDDGLVLYDTNASAVLGDFVKVCTRLRANARGLSPSPHARLAGQVRVIALARLCGASLPQI